MALPIRFEPICGLSFLWLRLSRVSKSAEVESGLLGELTRIAKPLESN
jgi:hypothetical protein